MNKTKIVCTLGPGTSSKEMIEEIILAGMDVARINMSHSNHKYAKFLIDNVREVSRKLDRNIGILVDLKGPEIRCGVFEKGYISLKKGDKVVLSNVDNDCLHISYDLSNDVSVGDKILLSDGLIELVVDDIDAFSIFCTVLNDGILESNKSVNVPNTTLNLEFLSPQDKDDVLFAVNENVDFLALSFVRNKDDVLVVSDMLNDHIQLISKIECKNAIDNLDDIIKISDGIMVARGDLGVEVELERVPGLQKKIINKCNKQNKICIVATEMLSSMEKNPRPTRAEVSDVANAVIDGADAVMLSGETAVGNYPVITVKTMDRIIKTTENTIDYDTVYNDYDKYNDVTTVLAKNVADGANIISAKAIVASTMSGYTARKVSNFRPSCPIIATTPSVDTALSLTLNWGIIPVVVDLFSSTDEIIENAKEVTKELIGLKSDDKIIITGGLPLTKNKTTNFMKIEEIE